MTKWDTFSMFKDIVFKGKINIVILKEERKNWCSYCKPLRFGLLWLPIVTRVSNSIWSNLFFLIKH